MSGIGPADQGLSLHEGDVLERVDKLSTKPGNRVPRY